MHKNIHESWPIKVGNGSVAYGKTPRTSSAYRPSSMRLEPYKQPIPAAVTSQGLPQTHLTLPKDTSWQQQRKIVSLHASSQKLKDLDEHLSTRMMPPTPQISSMNALKDLSRFLQHLWTMLNDPVTDDCICWHPTDRNSFIVPDQVCFANKILPRFFKHNKFSSFVRQLNMYQFAKVRDTVHLQWRHDYLQKDRPDLLHLIKRKLSNEEKKLQALVKELATTISEQQRQIMRLQVRMDALAGDVQLGCEIQLRLQHEVQMLKDTFRLMYQSMSAAGNQVVIEDVVRKIEHSTAPLMNVPSIPGIQSSAGV